MARVLRIYHAGQDRWSRARERALLAAGVSLHLIVPGQWRDGGRTVHLTLDEVPTTSLAVRRPGDVNRHAYGDAAALRRIIEEVKPDLVDIHEEPFSISGRQWLRATPSERPIVMYTAQNIDKRFPPPFARYEQNAYERVAALYPCSSQAASVARGKGFAGRIEVLPLGYDPTVFAPGAQSLDDEEVVITFAGRVVPEKGALDAVRILAAVARARPTRLVLAGSGPAEGNALALAATLGVRERIEVLGWQSPPELAALLRQTHVVLVPSTATPSWAEQFGRVIVEAQASGAVVAGYRSGSIPEVAGRSALLAEPGRDDTIARQVASLLADPGEFARRRKQGVEQVRASTWSEVARRHAALYDDVISGEIARVPLPHSAHARRAAARREFGPSAATPAGDRPFALPVLRTGGAAARAIARAVDAASEFRARLPSG